VYGDDEVARWIDERLSEHRAAIQAFRERRNRQQAGEPPDDRARDMSARLARALSRYEAGSMAKVAA
jgi:hypothetical protein